MQASKRDGGSLHLVDLIQNVYGRGLCVRVSAKIPPEARKLHTVPLSPRAETLLLCGSSLRPSEPCRPSRTGRLGRPRANEKNAKTKNRHFIHPASCGGEDVFFGLGCNDDKGSDAPFRTIDKRKRNARGAKGCGASRTAGARGSRAAAPEAPEPKNA